MHVPTHVHIRILYTALYTMYSTYTYAMCTYVVLYVTLTVHTYVLLYQGLPALFRY